MTVRSDLQRLTARAERAVGELHVAADEVHQIAQVVRGVSRRQQLEQLAARLDRAAEHLAEEVRAEEPRTIWQLVRSGSIVAAIGSTILHGAAGAAGGMVGAAALGRYQEQVVLIDRSCDEVGELTAAVLGSDDPDHDLDRLEQLEVEFEFVLERFAELDGPEKSALVATDRLKERSELVNFVADTLDDRSVGDAIRDYWAVFKASLDSLESGEIVDSAARQPALDARDTVLSALQRERATRQAG